ncbi:MAG: hypothetical protein ACX93N_04010 [Pseudohaliea sp.]
MKILLPVSLLAAARPVLAHDGHGLGNPLLHALDHGLLILAGAVAIGAAILGIRSLRRARRSGRSSAGNGESGTRA